MEPSPIRIEELLAHANWVRALATRLVRDPAAADDVTQEVWAYALRTPPRERTNLRGWLAAAVRSAASALRRGEQRREARERLAQAPREELGPAEFVERAQLHRELVEQVLALEEPQRSLVLAFWFEGLSVTEAGRRLGLSARVAKLRLDSAHENLRSRLDRKLGGREVWSALFWQWTKPAGLAVASA
jgi:RNA polymerase sigma-70 factor (ECF subfamily)